MIRELQQIYQFDWNITDEKIERRQQSNFQKLEETWWTETDEIFSTWGKLAQALLWTYQIIKEGLVAELFLITRKILRFLASQAILKALHPKLAMISEWGIEEREPCSLAAIHEEIITR